ncbi:MAG: hypothetical protein K0S23_2620 [Fluviicola sp.]|jgi:hypothetical protein|uniref:hypothetical protein n=1 Tax=Fluviicola sp. TaxID=1917219 RepID=UPI00260FF7BB|nr:hypothetical protein [Fluviicola sp.]MDF3028313.1 hypothetical protein [Fluviicola sp.]
MKYLILLLALFSVIFATFSQEEETIFTKDSIKSSEFLSQVDHVELCQVGLTCGKTRCTLIGAIRGKQIDYSVISKRKQLNNSDELFQILISSTQNTSWTSGDCYEPRNGILFFDKNGELLAYLEICFTCSSIKILNPFGIHSFSKDQYNDLEYIFNKKGLKTKE